MLIIGSHVSFGEEQLLLATKQAVSYGANAFMFYTGAPQNTIRRNINNKYLTEALNLMSENGIDINNVICHAPYIINLATPIEEKRLFSCNFLKKEIARCEALGITKIVLHPGSATDYPKSEAISRVVQGLNEVLTEDVNVMILLETMSGKGSECGNTFEELKEILDRVELKEKIGICLDTCHLNDAGYDMNEIDSVLELFDQIIGIDKIKCIHINDSKNNLGDKKDRHANFGYGTIGFDTLIKIVYHDKLKEVPKILETPFTGVSIEDKNRLYPPYKFEIKMIRDKKFNANLFNDIYNCYK